MADAAARAILRSVNAEGRESDQAESQRLPRFHLSCQPVAWCRRIGVRHLPLRPPHSTSSRLAGVTCSSSVFLRSPLFHQRLRLISCSRQGLIDSESDHGMCMSLLPATNAGQYKHISKECLNILATEWSAAISEDACAVQHK